VLVDFLGDVDYIVHLIPDARRLGGDKPSAVLQRFSAHFSPVLFHLLFCERALPLAIF
jgi:hypothetical protein